jgi:hypothetical protein
MPYISTIQILIKALSVYDVNMFIKTRKTITTIKGRVVSHYNSLFGYPNMPFVSSFTIAHSLLCASYICTFPSLSTHTLSFHQIPAIAAL